MKLKNQSEWKRPIVFFDLETTGLDPVQDRIVQIALIKITPDGVRSTAGGFLNPTIPIPPSVTAVHGITDEMVKNEPTFKDKAQSIVNFLSGCDIAGYNIIAFDLPMLLEELGRVGVEFDYSRVNLIDVMLIYKRLRPRTLQAAFEEFVGGERQGQHNALSDTDATIAVMEGILLTEPTVGDTPCKWMDFTVNRETLVDLSGKFIRDKDGSILFNFGPQKGNKVIDNMGMLKWMFGKNFTRDTMNWVNLISNDPSVALEIVSIKSDTEHLPFE